MGRRGEGREGVMDGEGNIDAVGTVDSVKYA